MNSTLFEAGVLFIPDEFKELQGFIQQPLYPRMSKAQRCHGCEYFILELDRIETTRGSSQFTSSSTKFV